MDRYFRWYDMSESKRVWFMIIKLTGQARHYWENAKRLMWLRSEVPVEIWDEMKEKFRQEYIPPSFSQQLLENWNG